MTRDKGPELPVFFTPRAGVEARELTLDPVTVVQATDTFIASFGAQNAKSWAVVIDDTGALQPVDLERRDELPASVRDTINEQLLGPSPRRIHLSELYLFGLLGIDPRIDRPGLNDPVALDGTLFDPFPSERPLALEGRLTITRGDLLQAAVDGDATRFFVTSHQLDPRVGSAIGPMLPGDEAATLQAGRGAVLAFPYRPFAAEQGAPGSERLLNEVLHRVLEQLREELEKSRPGDPLARIEIPVPSRSALAAQLRARGFTVDKERTCKPHPGLLGLFLAERIRLPEQATAADYPR